MSSESRASLLIAINRNNFSVVVKRSRQVRECHVANKTLAEKTFRRGFRSRSINVLPVQRNDLVRCNISARHDWCCQARLTWSILLCCSRVCYPRNIPNFPGSISAHPSSKPFYPHSISCHFHNTHVLRPLRNTHLEACNKRDSWNNSRSAPCRPDPCRPTTSREVKKQRLHSS